jgi:hypothetical protein
MKQAIETLNVLALNIKIADWSYDRSDDYGVYSRGRAQCQHITELMRTLEFDDEDIFYLEKKILESILNPKWTKEFTEEVMTYWSKKIEYLTSRR